MNQYLNDMLADTTYRAGKRYRDDHHHPLTFDVLAAGNVGRPSFDRNWFSGFEEWIQGCKDLAESRVVRQLLEVTAASEYEEDSIENNFKTRPKSSRQKEYHELKKRTCVTSESSFTPDVKEGNLDRCIKRTANMDLSTVELANENSAWLTKEIRSVRKKLKQIKNLLDADIQKVILSSEQKAKIARRPTLETELSIYETSVKEVMKRTKELNLKKQEKKKSCTVKFDDMCGERTEAQGKTFGTKGNKLILADDFKKDECRSASTPEQRDDKSLFCDVCGIKCSDKSNFILHQNGRKHRNKLAQIVETEKEKTATSIRQKQQIELMKSAQIFSSPSQKITKNVWRTPFSQPNYKLLPPPHPVLAQVVLSPSQSTLKGAWLAQPKNISSSSSSNSKTVANNVGSAKKAKPHPIINVDSTSHMKSFLPTHSNFTTILREQESAKKTLCGGMKESPKSSVCHSSPNSTRCVPQSLYSAPNLSLTPGIHHKYKERSPSISLANFLSPPKKKTTSSPAIAPWINSPTSKPDISPSPNRKSIAQIQAEEETLRLKQDKSYGKGGGSWYVERRERAESVAEIQKTAQEDLEHRILVEEQLKIEAQIREENNRRQKLEKEKSKKKRGKLTKKPQNSKKRNLSNCAKIEVRKSDAGKKNRSNNKKKPSNQIYHHHQIESQSHKSKSRRTTS